MKNTSEMHGFKRPIMMEYPQEQPAEVTQYDEQLVRRLIEKITVFDEKFVVEFKAGVKVDVSIENKSKFDTEQITV